MTRNPTRADFISLAVTTWFFIAFATTFPDAFAGENATSSTTPSPISDPRLRKIITALAVQGNTVLVDPNITAALGLTRNGDTLMLKRVTFRDANKTFHSFWMFDSGNSLFGTLDTVGSHYYYVNKNFVLIAAVTSTLNGGVSIHPNSSEATAGLSAELAYWAVERWSEARNSVLTDALSGLQWTQRDNSKDIDWKGAKRYCSSLGLAGGSWRLPTVDELTGLFSGGRDGTASCGTYRGQKKTCQVSSQFHLTGPLFWSITEAGTDAAGSARAWSVSLADGYWDRAPIGTAVNHRALCVWHSRGR